jgi:adenylate kinase
MENITGRRIHEESNRTYHIKYNPPKVEGIDDITGEPLTIRKEDDPVRVAKRMKVFHE